MDGSECVKLQRATGQLSFHMSQKRISRMYQSGSAKLMLPKTYSDMIEAVILNTSGGMTDGDIFNIDVQAAECTLLMTTQTAERIYRGGGTRPAKVKINLSVYDKADFHWLPQETIIFDGAGFSRHLNVRMDQRASFFANEMVVFGRTAMRETVTQGRIFDQWRIHHGDKLIHAEALRLEGNIFGKLDHPATAAGCISFATTIFIGRDSDEKANAAREFFKTYHDIKTAVSAWDGKLVVRSVCGDAARLKKVIARFIEKFRQIENPRVWNY